MTMPTIDRLWLTIIAVRQALIAWLFLSDHERYEQGVSFIVVAGVLPILWWAVIFATASVPAFVGVITARSSWGRFAIVVSLTLSSYWTVALIGAKFEARTASWLLAVVWGALTAKDALLAFGGLGTRRRAL